MQGTRRPTTRPVPRSRLPTIHGEHLARDPSRSVRREEEHRVRDIVSGAEAAHEDAAEDLLLLRLAIGTPLCLARRISAAEAGCDAIDGDAVLAKLEGELMRLKQGRGGGGGESGMVTPTTGGSSSARPFSSPVHDASAARRTRPPRMRF